MTVNRWTLVAAGLVASSVVLLATQRGGGQGGQQQQQQTTPPAQGQAGQAQAAPAPPDDIAVMVSRFELEKFKATLKGLTQFGDRREGTQRNRDAVDWIEAQLKSYGCTNTERIKYEARAGRGNAAAGDAPAGAAGAAGTGAGAAGAGAAGAAGPPAGAARGAGGQGAAAGGAATAGQGAGRGQGGGGQGGGRGGGGQTPTQTSGKSAGQGGSTIFGVRGRTGVNNNATAQADEKLRELNSGLVLPAPREFVYCTKIGTTHPEEMYIVSGHMDGIGWGQAANDDGSGTTVVMEMARIMSSPDVVTERSIRFALWNGEEGGLNGANAYVTQRKDLQGIENPKGSGKYPEPKWLGMVQHDMMMWDHGTPRPDGTVSREQRPEADINVEFQDTAAKADEAMKLAFFFKKANEKYATDYPATVGPHMTNTDSGPFMNIVPAISLRENERGAQIGGGWDPNWHQVTDVYTTYYDKDFLLGMNAAQTTLAAIAQLTGAKIKK
jgi:Peptidase family M28